MGRMVRGLLYFVGVAILVVALWKLFGGDIPGLFQRIGDFLWVIVDSGSNVLTDLWGNLT